MLKRPDTGSVRIRQCTRQSTQSDVFKAIKTLPVSLCCLMASQNLPFFNTFIATKTCSIKTSELSQEHKKKKDG